MPPGVAARCLFCPWCRVAYAGLDEGAMQDCIRALCRAEWEMKGK